MPADVDGHPLEPLARLTKGRDLGWPYCDPDPVVSPGLPTTAYDFSDAPFLRDVRLNPGGARLDCDRLAPVEQGLRHPRPRSGCHSPAARCPGSGRARWAGCTGRGTASPRAPQVAFFP